MTEERKKFIRDEVYKVYCEKGQSSATDKAIELGVRHYGYCEGCETESLVIDNICLICGQPTTKKPKQVGHTPGETFVNEVTKVFMSGGMVDGYQLRNYHFELTPIMPFLEDRQREVLNDMALAYNETKYKGINPEAVPDLLEALKEAMDLIDRLTGLYKDISEGRYGVGYTKAEYNKLQNAINKATKQ